jgi:hypothetical protein
MPSDRATAEWSRASGARRLASGQRSAPASVGAIVVTVTGP